jgi:hypothetical protein
MEVKMLKRSKVASTVSVVSVSAALLAVKHGIPEIIRLLEEPRDLGDLSMAIAAMSNSEFLALVLWIAIILFSILDVLSRVVRIFLSGQAEGLGPHMGADSENSKGSR